MILKAFLSLNSSRAASLFVPTTAKSAPAVTALRASSALVIKFGKTFLTGTALAAPSRFGCGGSLCNVCKPVIFLFCIWKIFVPRSKVFAGEMISSPDDAARRDRRKQMRGYSHDFHMAGPHPPRPPILP